MNNTIEGDIAERIPVRALSNYIYCPRLFYLQHVESIFVADKATTEGSAIHEKVDTPTIIEAEREPKHVLRSVELDSDYLGIVGVLDICEETSDGWEIVDYKRGSAGRNEEDRREVKPWDEVQVIAQVLLAEQSGMKVSGAYVYYAADKHRVRVLLTEEKKKKCLQIIAEAKQCAAAQILPPALCGDWKCSYCSIAPICLPHESNVWAEAGGESVKDMRPPVVEDDTREVLVVHSFGASVGLSAGKVQIKVKNELRQEIPFHQLRAIYVYGAVQLTSHLLVAALEAGVQVGHFSAAGKFIGMTSGLGTTGTLARRGQYRMADNENECLQVARQMISAKIHNQRVLLLRHADETEDEVRALSELKRKSLVVESLDSLRGIEGAAAAKYFGSFKKVLKVSECGTFDFNGRNRRPPRDPVNALLSMGYSMLAKELTGICILVGLDPYLGIYHRPRLGRPALALDIMEEFRPLIVDSVVITLINRQELQKSDFQSTSRGVFLKDSSRRVFWEAWFRRLDTEVKHPVFGYQMSYRRMLEVQVRQLWRVFCGEAKSYHGFVTR